MKLNITNFWNASVGTWNQIDRVPDGFECFANSGSSSYYTDAKKKTVVRVSDHWGSGIKECNWYLKGYPRNNSFLFSKHNDNQSFIGMIDISDLTDIQNL